MGRQRGRGRDQGDKANSSSLSNEYESGATVYSKWSVDESINSKVMTNRNNRCVRCVILLTVQVQYKQWWTRRHKLSQLHGSFFSSYLLGSSERNFVL